MIKKITLLLLLSVVVLCANAKENYYDIIGTTYKVDTLFHAQVGPGTTQTSLLFKGPTYNLRAFYVTIDLKTPNVSIRTLSGNDMVAGNGLTSEMAKSHSVPGKVYYAGVNGDFFATGGTSTNGKSIVGTPVAACIVDSEFYKTSSINKQFAIDQSGLPFIGLADFSAGTAECGANKVLFKAVNTASPDNGITIFTPRYYGSTNQTNRAGNCAELTAKLVEGEIFMPGKSCKMEITSTSTSTGDLVVPNDGFVLHGRGSNASGGTMGALAFVQGLKIGDVVTINSVVSIDKDNIVPIQMVSGNPRTVGNGETLDTEGERGDASAFHPRTGIGYGDNKGKVIMMVVDGRSSISHGVRTSQLGDIMRYAGATDAINLDGGGSSTLYTSALGIRNRTADGKERADGNAIYAVSDAPEDNVVASIKFVDWAMVVPQYCTYKPKFYGYNKYGMLIDTDVKNVNLSCSSDLGDIQPISTPGVPTIICDGSGTHALTATLGNLTTSIPVTIIEGGEMSMRHVSIINDTYRNYPVEVEAIVKEEQMPIAPSALTWSTDDASIAMIDASTGVLKGVTDGETTIHGVLGTFNGSMQVVVEKPTARVMAIEPNLDPSTWIISQTGGNIINAVPMENGMKIKYTGNSSSRGANIKLAKRIKVWSLPDAIRLRINPGDAPIKSIKISTNANEGGVISTELGELVANQMNELDLPTDKWCDTKDMASYPIYINNIYFGMGASTVGKEYTIEIPGFEAIYNVADPGSVEGIIADNSIAIYPNPVKSGETANISVTADTSVAVSVYNTRGQIIKSLETTPIGGYVNLSTVGLVPSAYFVTVAQNGVIRNGKIIVE